MVLQSELPFTDVFHFRYNKTVIITQYFHQAGKDILKITQYFHQAGKDISKIPLPEQQEVAQTDGNTFGYRPAAGKTIAEDSAPLNCLPNGNQHTNPCQFFTTAYQYNGFIKKYLEFIENQEHAQQIVTSNNLPLPPGLEDSLNQLETSRVQPDHQDLVQGLRDRDYRLPENLHPIHYDLSLKIYHWGNATFEGRVVIQVRAEENTDHILLHCFQLELLWDTISVSS